MNRLSTPAQLAVRFVGPTGDDEFARRAEQLLQSIAALPRPAYDTQRRLAFHSIARLGLGLDLDRAFADLAEINRDPGSAGMFFWHANADLWCRFSHLYPQPLRETVQAQITSHDYRVLDGHTENHRIMIATGGYLTAQAFPQWEKSEEVFHRSEEYLLRFFDRVRRFGQGEFSASTYGVFYLSTLGSLAELADDPAMRQAATDMLDWLLAGLAGLWLDCRLTGGHARDAGPVFGIESPGAAEVAMWLFFGGGDLNPNAHEPHYSVINALGSYRPRSMITAIACDRSEPYEQFESHDLTDAHAPTHDGNATHLIDQDGTTIRGNGYISRAGVRKYTYMTQSYSLGCIYEGKESDIIWTGQARRWSLDFVTARPSGKLFFTHPIRDGEKTGSDYWRNWIGSSPYEQVLQHRSTLIALYRIPHNSSYKSIPRQPVQGDEFAFIDGYFCRALRVVQDHPEGWIFAHGGSTLIAARTLRPGEWIDDNDPLERSAFGRCYRSMGYRNGVILETACAHPDSFNAELPALQEELAHFAGRVLSLSHIDRCEIDCDRPVLSYTDSHGHTLCLEYDGTRMVDGRELDFGTWPLLRNRWVDSCVGVGGFH